MEHPEGTELGELSLSMQEKTTQCVPKDKPNPAPASVPWAVVLLLSSQKWPKGLGDNSPQEYSLLIALSST